MKDKGEILVEKELNKVHYNKQKKHMSSKIKEKKRGMYDLRELPRWDIINFSLRFLGIGALIGFVIGHLFLTIVIAFIFLMFINTTTR